MTLITEQEQQTLSIEKFIFHVVHHGEDEPILLDETPIGQFASFFVERVKQTLRGNRFIFLPDSTTLQALQELDGNPDRFVEISQRLAREFHTRRDRRIKPGVLIVMKLTSGQRTFYSLLKYDHERVVVYDLKDRSAVLRDIANSFTQAPNALHKSALVELVGDNAEVVVIDRTVRSDITEFFRGFLNVKRKFSASEMTQQVEKTVIATVKTHKDQLPPDVTLRVRERLRQAVDQEKQIFDATEFFDDFFREHATDSVRKTFDRQIVVHGLDGEVFPIDREVLQTPRKRKYRTVEGVVLEIPEQASDTVTINGPVDGIVTVEIRTRNLIEQ